MALPSSAYRKHAKLTLGEVRLIRRLRQTDYGDLNMKDAVQAIAGRRRWGVTTHALLDIVRGDSWYDPEPDPLLMVGASKPAAPDGWSWLVLVLFLLMQGTPASVTWQMVWALQREQTEQTA